MAAGSPALPTPAALHEAFLWSEWRTVTKTATVNLFANSYEVDQALVGAKVELVGKRPSSIKAGHADRNFHPHPRAASHRLGSQNFHRR